jgi:hypothetical protein
MRAPAFSVKAWVRGWWESLITATNSSVARFGLTYAEYERVTDGDRTRDLRSHNPMLCQLSYGHQVHARFYQEKAGGKTLSTQALMVA